MNRYRTVVRNFTTYNKHYVIVFDRESEHYLAVDTNYIDENGNILKSLNGLEMHASRTARGCMLNALIIGEVYRLRDEGKTDEEIKQFMLDALRNEHYFCGKCAYWTKGVCYKTLVKEKCKGDLNKCILSNL